MSTRQHAVSYSLQMQRQNPLLDWISNTRSQGYTICGAWQNAWIMELLRQIQYAVKQENICLLFCVDGNQANKQYYSNLTER